MQHQRKLVKAATGQPITSTSRFNLEPTLTELFDDPITRAIMRADRVDHRELDALLQHARRSVPFVN